MYTKHRKIRSIIALMLASALMLLACASLTGCKSSGTYTPDMWIVTKDGCEGQVYLFGSIHVGDPDMYPLPKQVTDAYEQSDEVAVECNIVAFEQLDPGHMDNCLLQFIYNDDTKILDHLPSETYGACKQILQDNGLYNKELTYYSSAYWYTLVNQAIALNSACDANYGVDRTIMRTAMRDHKPIIEIESVEYQFKLENEVPEETYALMLSACTDDDYIDDGADQLEALVKAWKNGTPEDVLYSNDGYSENEQKLLGEYDRIMISQRNVRMADAAEQYVQSGEKVFMVVGSAHMYRGDGIVALLQSRGFTVTPVNYNNNQYDNSERSE